MQPLGLAGWPGMNAQPLLDRASLPGSGVSALAAPFVPPNANPDLSRKSAEIVAFPKATFPAVSDYAKRCAALIRETFPAPSQHQMCIAAARMTGASPDTFDRILAGQTKSPDAKLMLTVLAIRAATGGVGPLTLVAQTRWLELARGRA